MTENLKSAAVSDRGLSEKRPQNEDSFLEMPERGLFVVADGVGGANAGEVASQMAVEILGEAFANLKVGGDAEDLMKMAIERANEAIFQTSNDLPQLSSMATTIVALHIDGNIATIGHVGDSRIYRIDPNGNLFRETQDHSVVEEEVRAGRMTAAQAANHPSRNIISRALGAESSVQVDLKTIMIEPNTSFLLCSDGITRHIEDNEIRQLLNSGSAPEQICEDMKHICYGRGAEDNLTAVIAQVIGVGAPAIVTDSEENTVAGSRPLVSNDGLAGAATAAAVTTQLDPGDIPTQNLEMPATDNFKTVDSFDNSQFSAAPPAEISNQVNEADAAEATASAAPRVAETKNTFDESDYAVENNSKDGFLGKLMSALALLLIGAALGAGGYYFLKQSQPQPTVPTAVETPKITQMQTPNIAYSAFEDNRRNVDKNAAQFIAANGANAQDSEDFYLVGRAYLIQGNYALAKENFEKAKQLLAQTDTADKQLLTNEINFGLSIVDSQYSRRFLDSVRSVNPAPNTMNGNSNTNAQPDTEIKPLSEQPQTTMPQVQ